jgi:hypothetical protein
MSVIAAGIRGGGSHCTGVIFIMVALIMCRACESQKECKKQVKHFQEI